MLKKTALATALFGLVSFGATAAEPLTPYEGAVPAVLEFAKASNGLQPMKKFEAIGGLTGWVVHEPQSAKDIIVYTTADGENLLAGMIVDKNGVSLSGKYAEDHIPKPDMNALYDDFKKNTANVVVGSKKAKAEAIVLFDANCGYCKMMHKFVEPAIANNTLRVTYVPVAILAADSVNKGAGLLAAKDPVVELHAAAADQAVSISRDEKLVGQVQANTTLMKRYGYTGTPVVIYKSKHEGAEAVVVSNGVPPLPEFYERLNLDYSMLEKVKKDNPALARFIP